MSPWELFQQEVSQLVDTAGEHRGPSNLLDALLDDLDWDTLQSLFNENGATVEVSTNELEMDEDAALREEVPVEASEEIVGLVNKAFLSMAKVIDVPATVEKLPIELIQPRVMSGYIHPGLSRKEIRHQLSRSLLSNGFRLTDAGTCNFLVDREVILPTSPSLPLPIALPKQAAADEAIFLATPPAGLQAETLYGNSEESAQTIRNSALERGRPDLHSSHVEQDPLLASTSRDILSERETVPKVSSKLPVAEIGYETVCFTGSGSLKGLLLELGVEVGEDALKEVLMLEPAFLGPAIARNEAKTEISTWQGTELAEWLIEAMRGKIIETPMEQGTRLPNSDKASSRVGLSSPLASRVHPEGMQEARPKGSMA